MWESNLKITIKNILSMKQFDLYSHINHIIYTELFLQYIFAYYTPRKQSLGVYRNHPVLPSVRPSMYLVSELLLSCLLDFYETLHICSALPADVHEGIWLLSKI